MAVRSVWFLIHDRRQLFRYTGPSVGSDLARADAGISRFRRYEVTVIKLSPDGDAGCHRNEDYSLGECMMAYLERMMGCSLSWVEPHGLKLCDFSLNETLWRYYDMVNSLMTLNQPQTYQVTGCRVRCTYQRFNLKAWEKDNFRYGRSNASSMQFVAVGGDGEVEVRTETPIYTWLDLVAEVGGYMGLLLGASVLSTYDLVMDMNKSPK